VIPDNLPDYVERGGEQVWRPPYTARQVDLYGFVAPADQAAIDELLQRDLVLPSGYAVDYRCAHPNIVVTFGAIGHEASDDPIDSARGYITEREVSIWCLVADVAATGRLLWYLPYIFTDSGQTVATGREVYGYPKQLGYFDSSYPEKLGDAGGTTTVRALAISPYAPSTRAEPRAMVSVKRKPGPASLTGARAGLIDDLASMFYPGVKVNASLPYGPGPEPSATITTTKTPPPRKAKSTPPWIRAASPRCAVAC